MGGDEVTSRPELAPAAVGASSRQPSAVAREPAQPKLEWACASAGAALVACVSALVSRVVGLGLFDDGYISLRYAESWAHGLGFVYNPGERVEGFSNFLYIVLEALLIRAGVDAELAALLPSALAQAAIAPVVFWLLRSQGVGSRIGALSVAVLIALEPSMVAWSRSGLEGPLYAVLLLAALGFALRAPVTRRSVAAAMAAATLAAFTRPEGVLLVPLTAATLAREPAARRLVLRAGALAAMVCGAGFLARRAYYGYWLPNTYYAKLDGGSVALLERGAEYVGSALMTAWPALLLALVGLWLVRPGAPGARTARWLRIVLAWLCMLSTVVAWEGGDYMPMFRFISPLYPLLGIAALGPWLVLKHERPGTLLARAALPTTWLAFVIGGATLVFAPLLPESHGAMFLVDVERARLWAEAGDALRERSPPDALIGAMAIGGIGQRSGRVIIDGAGLIDARVAHARIELGKSLPGHEKFDIDAFFDRRPHAIVLPPQPVDMKLPRAWINTVIEGGFLTAIKEDPRLDRDYALYYVPVGPAHWLHTFVRRDQIARWKLDPSLAAER